MLYSRKRDHYPLISIVTVNFNQAHVTCEFIESLNKITYPNIEIIVVDNFSEEDDAIIIKRKYPNIVFVESPINYGFAAGNNYGIMRAKGEYILLLNNDTVVTESFIEPLLDKLERNPGIGAVSSKIRFFHTPDTLQYAGFTEMNPLTIRNFSIGFNEKDKGQYDKDRETAFAHGAAMMLPMRVVKKIGMMSYIFFLYYEEADWCARIKAAGYKIYYVHNSLVYHRESISTGKHSPVKIYYLNRNRIIYMRRNINGKAFYVSLLYLLFVAIPKNTFKFLIKGKFKLFHAYYRAIGWNIKNLWNKEVYENPML